MSSPSLHSRDEPRCAPARCFAIAPPECTRCAIRRPYPTLWDHPASMPPVVRTSASSLFKERRETRLFSGRHSSDDGRGARVPPSQPRVRRLRFGVKSTSGRAASVGWQCHPPGKYRDIPYSSGPCRCCPKNGLRPGAGVEGAECAVVRRSTVRRKGLSRFLHWKMLFRVVDTLGHDCVIKLEKPPSAPVKAWHLTQQHSRRKGNRGSGSKGDQRQ